MLDIREHIKSRMIQRRITQVQLAAATGIPQPNISEFLAGTRDMRTTSVNAMLKVLGARGVDWGRDGLSHRLKPK